MLSRRGRISSQRAGSIAIAAIVTIGALALVTALAYTVYNAASSAFDTIVAISDSRRNLDDLRVAAMRETNELFRYGRTHDASDLESFSEDTFREIAAEGDRLLIAADAPLARASLRHASALHESWHARAVHLLLTDAAAYSPPGKGVRSPNLALLDMLGTMNAVNADGSTIRALLADRMDAEYADIKSRMPRIFLLGLLLTAAFALASIAAVVMARGFYKQRALSRRLATVFDSAALPKLESARLDGIVAHAANEERVGGDWYDARRLPDGRILLSIGDVAGHGVAAAIDTATLRRELLAAAIGESDPAIVLACVNREHTLRAGAYVAMLCAFYDPKTQGFTYASAGLPAPLVCGAGDAAFAAYGGPFIGVLGDSVYERHDLHLPADTTVVLYTDGAIEDSHDTQDGERRLAAAATAMRGEPSARALFDRMFGKRVPLDDVAILTLQVGAVA